MSNDKNKRDYIISTTGTMPGFGPEPAKYTKHQIPNSPLLENIQEEEEPKEFYAPELVEEDNLIQPGFAEKKPIPLGAPKELPALLPDRDKAEILYNGFTQRHPDMPYDFAEFYKRLATPGKAKVLYEGLLREHGEGSKSVFGNTYEDFATKLGVGDIDKDLYTDPKRQMVRNIDMQRSGYNAQQVFDAFDSLRGYMRDNGISLTDDAEQVQWAEGTPENVKDLYKHYALFRKNTPYWDELWESYDRSPESSYSINRKKQAEELFAYLNTEIGRIEESMEKRSNEAFALAKKYNRTPELLVQAPLPAQSELRQLRRRLNLPKRGEEGDAGSWLKQFTKGFGAGFSWSDLVTLGWGDLIPAMEENKVLEKLEKGEPLNEYEQDIFDIVELKQNVEGYIQSMGGVTTAASVGSGVGQMVPYMAGFTVGSSGAKALTAPLLKKVTNSGAKSWVKTLATSAIQATPATAFTPTAYLDFQQRTKEQYFDDNGSLHFDEEGNLHKWQPTSTGKRLYQAAVTGFLENFSEMGIGELLSAPMNKLTQSVGNRLGLGRLYKMADNSNFKRFLRDDVRWNGSTEEFLEELFNNVTQPLLTGEPEQLAETLSAQNLWETYLVCAITGSAFNASAITGEALSLGVHNLALRHKERDNLKSISTDYIRVATHDAMHGSSISNMVRSLSDIDWSKASREDIAGVLSYIQSRLNRLMVNSTGEAFKNVAEFADKLGNIEKFMYKYNPEYNEKGELVSGSLSDEIDTNIVFCQYNGSTVAIKTGDYKSSNPSTPVTIVDNTGTGKTVTLGQLSNIQEMPAMEYMKRAFAEISQIAAPINSTKEIKEDAEISKEAGVEPIETVEEAIAENASTVSVAEQDNRAKDSYSEGEEIITTDGRKARIYEVDSWAKKYKVQFWDEEQMDYTPRSLGEVSYADVAGVPQIQSFDEIMREADEAIAATKQVAEASEAIAPSEDTTPKTPEEQAGKAVIDKVRENNPNVSDTDMLSLVSKWRDKQSEQLATVAQKLEEAADPDEYSKISAERNAIQEKIAAYDAAVAMLGGTQPTVEAETEPEVQPTSDVEATTPPTEQPTASVQEEIDVDSIIDRARAGDMDAIAQLDKYGIDWKPSTVYRHIGQSEMDALFAGKTVNGKFDNGRVDVTSNPEPSTGISAEYRVTFKPSFDFGKNKGVMMKNAKLGDGWTNQGYTLEDVQSIHKRNPDGSYTEVYDAEQQAHRTAPASLLLDPRTMLDEEKQRRGDKLRNAPAIEVKQGTIASTTELSARKAAEKWWDENVGKPVLYNTEVGEVEINRNSIEDSLAHHYGQKKLDAITSLVEGFENAVYLGTMKDSTRQEGVLNHYFAYPIMYGGELNYVFCRAMQDANKNRLYVHEVFLVENIKKGDTLQTAASQPHGGISLYRDILANVLSDNKDTTFVPENQISEKESTDTQVTQAEQDTNIEPTEAQKEAGNYKKGHIKIDGFDITIETPKGVERSGVDEQGNKWSVTMNNTYGYIRGTEGVDGDHIDLFLSDNLDNWNGNVYVIDQVKPDGSFDEHKVMYGFNSIEEAQQAYMSNYSEGWQGLGTITGTTKEEFQKWVASSHRKTKPFAEYKNVKTTEGQAESKAAEQISLEDYLGRLGLRSPISEFMDDKLRNPHGLTANQKKQLERDAAAAIEEYQERRRDAIRNYSQLVEEGKIIPPSRIDMLLSQANGHPDNEATQAARKALEKRGYNWETGEKTNQQSNISPSVEKSPTDEFAAGVAEQGYIERLPKNTKYNVWSFTADKSLRPIKTTPYILEGVFYDNGFRIATDSQVLVKEKFTSYPTEYEGTTRMRDGSRTDNGVKYPNYKVIIDNLKGSKAKSIDFEDFLGFLNAVEERVTSDHKETEDKRRSLKDALNNTPVAIKLPTGEIWYGSLAKLQKFALVAKQFGVDNVYFKDASTMLHAKNSKGEVALVMPVNVNLYKFEGLTRYYYAPELETKPQSTQTEQFAPIEIGENSWGKVYQWVKGKALDAANFLKRTQSGYLKGVFYREGIGDIDMVWGNKKGGLHHIIDKHIINHSDFSSIEEAVSIIEDTIQEGKISLDKGKTIFTKRGYRVAIEKTSEGSWIISAYDQKLAKKDKKRSEEDATNFRQDIFNEENGTPVSPNSASFEDKDTTTKPKKQANKDVVLKSSALVSEKIDDFGEKIGGARKDVARERVKDSAKLSRTDLATLKDPDKILSRTNIIKYMREGQMTPDDATTLLALNMAVRGESGGQSKAVLMDKYRQCALDWVDGKDLVVEVTDVDIEAYTSAFSETIRSRSNFAEVARKQLEYALKTYKDYKTTYEAINYPEVNRAIKSAYIRYGEYDQRYWVVGSPAARRGFPFSTLEQAVAKLKKEYPEIKEAPAKSSGTSPSEDKVGHLYVTKDNRGYYRIKSRQIPGNIYLSGRLYSKKEAEQYLKDNAEKLIAREERMSETLMGSNIGMVERQGKDYRQGKDVTPQDFLDTFGFRGVEFGNWVPQAERQLYLNKSYDAIMDLCNAISISPKAFSLGGRLGLAFGARGKSKALAHYEPVKEVINLTRLKGAGSLAHEWFHALDNYMSKQVTGNVTEMATSTYRAERTEVTEAFRELVRVMDSLPYTRRSKNAGDYWGEVWERAARLFQSYIYNSLQEKNTTSPLLVRGDALFVESDNADPDFEASSYPYPSAEENEKIKPYFDKLFQTIQEREEGGKTILYQVEEGEIAPPPATITTQEIVDLVRATGVEVEMVTPEAMIKPEATFYSNAEYAVQNIKQEKATPEQWLKMIEKNGGLKAGEDKWLGLSDWLKEKAKVTPKDKPSIITINGIDYNVKELEETILSDIKAILDDNGFDDELMGVRLVGSYARGEQRPDSDIDVIVEYKGDSSEDTLFNVLNDEDNRISIEGINVDVNPITEGKSGTLDEWEKRNEGFTKKPNTLTKEEILDYINANKIQVEEVEYGADAVGFDELKAEYEALLRSDGYDAAHEAMTDRYGDDFDIAFEDLGGELIIANEEAAATLLGSGNIINSTRLEYTTNGLTNKREIALVVPTIESWNRSDEIHFGDAGEGRAVAWVRFGDAEAPVRDANYIRLQEIYDRLAELEMKVGSSEGITMEEYEERARLREERDNIPESDNERILVIDEIESKRHQEGREKGYRTSDIDKYLKDNNVEVKETGEFYEFYKNGELDKRFSRGLLHYDINKAKNLYVGGYQKSDIPEAPFEKNWYEVAMKRILRYAAENGYDKVAWTTGDQQAERYNIGNVIESAEIMDGADGGSPSYRAVVLTPKNDIGNNYVLYVNEDGIIRNTEGAARNMGLRDKHLSDVVGKALAEKLLSSPNNTSISGEGLRIGGEGMRAFYDQILPNFMNKYGKKWGVKVGEVTMPDLAENNTMLSVDVTPAMRESVLRGQPLFLQEPTADKPEGVVYGWMSDGKIYLTEQGLNPETPIHEYTHIWDMLCQQENPDLWAEGVKLMKQLPLWGQVKNNPNYANIADNENLLASEVHARLVAPDGANILATMLEEKSVRPTFVSRLRTWLSKVWRWLRSNLMPGTKLTIEQFKNMPLRDLANGKPMSTQDDIRFRSNEMEDFTPEEQEIAAKAKADGTYLLAPNGKPTNLTPKQWVQVRTKAFIEWFGDWELAELAEYLMGEDVVAILNGNEFAKDGTLLTEKVTKFYEENYNGKVERKGLGDVILDKRSVKDSTIHGFGKTKAAAFAAVPQIITNGRIIDAQKNWKGRNYDSVTIAAPIKIGKSNYVGIVIIHKGYGTDTNRFYLHEVVLQKNLQDESFKTDIKADSHQGDIANIMQKIFFAKENTSKVVDANGEPMVVYHGSNWKGITTFDRSQSKRRRSGLKEYGHFFTTNRALAEMYSLVDDAPEVKEELARLDDQIEAAAEKKDIDKMLDLYTEKERITRNLGGRVYEVFLNMRDVAEFDAEYQAEKGWYNLKADVGYKTAIGRDAIEAYAGQNGMTGNKLRKDGIIARNIIDLFVGTENKDDLKPYFEKYGGDVFLVFDPQNIKSATENVGTFDANNPDIRYRTPNMVKDSKKVVTYDNYFVSTAGIWQVLSASDAPTREPDYVSKRWDGFGISSRYWYGQDEGGKYIIRESDHWSRLINSDGSAENFERNPYSQFTTPIASCRWALDIRGRYPKLSENLPHINGRDGRILREQDSHRRQREFEAKYQVGKKLYGKTYLQDLTHYNKLDDVRYRGGEADAGVTTTQQMANVARELATSLHTPIEVYTNVEDITDANAYRQRRMRRDKGWWTSNGTIGINLSMHESVADVEATILHEVVGHKGLREVVGSEEAYNNLLDRVWSHLTPEEQKSWESRYADRYEAMDEYLATLAEGNVALGVWDRIVGWFRELLDRITGRRLQISDRDIAYLLWKSRTRLQKPKSPEEAIATARADKKYRNEAYRSRRAKMTKYLDTYAEPTVSRYLSYFLSRNGFNDKLIPEDRRGRFNQAVYDFLPKEYQAIIKARNAEDPLQEVDKLLRRKQKWGENENTMRGVLGEKLYEAMLGAVLPNFWNRQYVNGVLRQEYKREQRRAGEVVNDYLDKGNSKATFEHHGKVGSKKWKRKLFDYAEPVQQLQKMIMESFGVVIDDNNNIYSALNRWTSRANVGIDRFEMRYMRPLLLTMREIERNTEMKYEDIVEYVMCKSAVERDDTGIPVFPEEYPKEISTEPKIPNWNRKYAKKVIKLFEENVEQKYRDALWAQINLMNKASLDNAVASGNISLETKQRILSHNWKYYVPLIGWDMSSTSAIDATKFYDFGESTYYKGVTSNVYIAQLTEDGRTTRPADPIANMINFGYRAIISGENNKMKQVLGKLLMDASAAADKQGKSVDAIFSVATRYVERSFSGKGWHLVPLDAQFDEEFLSILQKSRAIRNSVAKLKRQLREENLSADEKRQIFAKITELQESEYVRELYHGETINAGELPLPQELDDQRLVHFYINGQKQTVKFADPLVAMAINGELLSAQDKFSKAIGNVTRTLSGLFTTYNPAFLISNSVRDFRHAFRMHTLDSSYGGPSKFVRNLPSTYGAIWRTERGKANPLTKAEVGDYDILGSVEDRAKLMEKYGRGRVLDTLYDVFKEQGGETGFVFIKSVDEIESNLRKIARRNTLKNKSRVARWGIDVADFLKDGYDAVAMVSEASTRFATFIASLEKGLTSAQATQNAKDITVNFNRKGELSKPLGSLYLFFNASMQAAYQEYNVVKKNPKRVALWAAVRTFTGILNSVLAAWALDLINGADDDERNDLEIPLHVRLTNTVIPLFSTGKYLKIPHAQGSDTMFNSLGVYIYELVSGNMSGWDFAGNLTSLPFDSFSPLATPKNGSFARTFIPTILTPIYDIWVNEDWLGRPIRKERYSDSTPEYKLALASTPKVFVDIAKGINNLLGGNDIERMSKNKKGEISGLMDKLEINPSNMHHILQYYAGGSIFGGKFFWNTANTISYFRDMATKGESDIDIYNELPIMRRFLGEAYVPSKSGDYYNLLNRLKVQHDDYNKYRERKRETGEPIPEHIANDEQFYQYINRIHKVVKREQDLIKENELNPEEQKAIQQKIQDIMFEGIYLDEHIDDKAPDWKKEFARVREEYNQKYRNRK